MTHDKKLHILEDVHAATEKYSGTAVRLWKGKQTSDEVFEGIPTVWHVQTLGVDRNVVETTKRKSLELITFLGESEVENILVSVDDSRQLVGMMLRPRVAINLSASTIEYFERDTYLSHIIEGFLRDVYLS